MSLKLSARGRPGSGAGLSSKARLATFIGNRPTALITFTRSDGRRAIVAAPQPLDHLFAAGLAEVGFTTFTKLSNGFRNWTFDVCFAICALASFGLLNLATRHLSLGTAYAVWTGIGAFGTAAVGIALFGEIRPPSGGWSS